MPYTLKIEWLCHGYLYDVNGRNGRKCNHCFSTEEETTTDDVYIECPLCGEELSVAENGIILERKELDFLL